MKNLNLLLLAICLLTSISLFSQSNIEQSISIRADGNAPDASAILDVQSTTQGVLVPRMTAAERDAIASPATGLTVFVTSDSSFYYYDGTNWPQLGGLPAGAQFEDFLQTDANGNAIWAPLIAPELVPQPCPAITGILPIGTNPRSIAVQGIYAYIVDEDVNNLLIVNISNPTKPVVANGLIIGDHPWSVAVQGDYVYVVDNVSGMLDIIDVSNLLVPMLTGSVALGGAPIQVVVQGDYAYVANSQLQVIDISTPAAPAIVGSLSVGTLPGAVAVQGNYAYVGDQVTEDFNVVDVSTPATPVIVGTTTDGQAQSLAVQGDYVYRLNDDFMIFDVNPPTTPSFVSSLITFDGGKSIAVTGNFVVTVDDFYDNLKVVNVSDPPNPIILGILDIGSEPISVAVQGNYAYVVDTGSDDLKVVQLSQFVGLGLDMNGDMKAYVDPDSDPTNELITAFNFTGVDIEITDAGGTHFVNISGLKPSTLADEDMDTRIQVEENPDEDIIRMDLEGSERLVIRKNNVTGNHTMIEMPNSDDNTFLGTSAGLNSNATGVDNTFIGSNAGANNTSGNQNTIVGRLAGFSNTGNSNAIFGHSAGDSNTGDGNAFMGLLSGQKNQGGNNTFYGSFSGQLHETGSANTFLGSSAGRNNISGNSNVFIGNQAGENELGSNRLYIDNSNTATPLIWGDFSANRMGVNRVATTNTFEVGGTASKAGAGDWLANSDARLKKNIRPLHSDEILEKLLSLQGVNYEWNDTQTGTQRPEGIMYGFTAQNIQEVFPELVTEDNLGFLQTAYGTYDAMYVEAIRALKNEINDQKAEIENLQSQLTEMDVLKQQLARLEAAVFSKNTSTKESAATYIKD